MNFFHNEGLLSPDGVEIRLVGDIERGRSPLCSHLALDCVAMLYCVRGAMSVSLSDAGVFELKDGDIMVVFPGRHLSIDTIAKSNRIMFIGLRGPNAVAYALGMGFWDLMRGNDPYQGDFFSSIVERFESAPEHGRDPLLLGRVGQLLDMIWSHMRNGVGPAELYDAVRVINRLPYDRMTTEAAAEALCISRTKLNTLMMKGGFGRPGKYLARIRFMLAESMLYFTHDSQEQIAARLGFCSAAAFGVFFRKQCDRTPGAFRKACIVAK